MLYNNTDVQNESVSLPVDIASEDKPSTTLLELSLKVFSSCSRAYKGVGQASSGMKLGDLSIVSTDTDVADPIAPATALIATLKFISYWLASCPIALKHFASSPVTVPLTMELTACGSTCGAFFRETFGTGKYIYTYINMHIYIYV